MKPYRVERIERACLFVILLLALGLRCAGLRWGLPDQSHLFSYHPDEAPVLGAAWYMLVQGDWDPHFYNYGTFYIYLVAICANAAALLGFMTIPQTGWVELHLIARAITALMGVATVYVVYLLGKRLGGAAVGLGAAALLAVLPAHVINSHYATVDIPATFLVSLMAVILLRLFGRADFASYLLAGLALGLATATKYAMVIAVAPLLAAHIFARDDQDYAPSVLYPIAALAAACLAFFAVTPYLLVMGHEGFRLNPDVVRDVTFEMRHMRAGGTFAFAGTGAGWIYHLVRSLPAGMGYPALALGLVGGALMAWRGGPVGVVLLVFALPYFGVIGASKERFLRYTLPLLPALAIAAPYALDRLREASVAGLGKRQAIIAPALLGAALFGVTLCYSWQTVRTMTGPDPRTSAARWLQARASRSTRIGLASVPWYFTPPITPFNGGERSREQFIRWQRAHPPYRVIVIGWDAAELRRQRPDYFVVSDAEYADLLRLRRAEAAALMEALPRRYPDLEAFEPPPPAPWLRPGKLACPPDWLYTWPRIEVYH